MGILRISEVSKHFGTHTALKDIGFEVPTGSIFGLLGPNGAGKTTLIRIINQILMPDEGQVYFEGAPLQTSHIRKIGYLPEERGLYKKMKVGEQLIYLGRLRGLSGTEARKKTGEWLQRLELENWWNKSVEDLSKGMQQKVQFISTVLHTPPLIILDEPFSGFDPVNTQLIRREIERLNQEGATVIFSTHRMESVEELCSDLVMINRARKVLEGKVADIRNKYKQNTFLLEYQGHWSSLHQDFPQASKIKTDNGSHQVLISLDKDSRPNTLIQQAASQVEVKRFEEIIPSMNEIFIRLVTEKEADE